MKVYEDQGLLMNQTVKNVRRKQDAESEFKAIMDEKMTKVDQQEARNTHRNVEPAVNGIQILNGADKIAMPSGAFKTQPVLDEILKSLDLIDFYAGKLGDGSLDAQSLDPLVTHLEESVERLKGMEDTPGFSEELKPILSDVVLTLGTEIAKYRRGDYS